eukprot:g1663.t1
MKTATDFNAIQQQDPTYAAGVAHGGSPGQDGMPGLVVIETRSIAAPRWPGDTVGVARRLGGTGMCSVEDIIQRSYCEGTGSSYYRYAQDEIDTGFQPDHVPSYFAL